MTHLRHAVRLFLQRPFTSLLGAAALALGLVLAGLALWVLDVTGQAEEAIEADLVLRVRLDSTLDEPRTREVLLAIAKVEGVSEVAWVGPAAQRDELVAILGADLLAGLDSGVFPHGGLARVTLDRTAISQRDGLDALLGTIAKLDMVKGVEDVPYDPRHLAFLFAAAAVARIVALGLALVALLAGVLSVHQRLALALAARAQELAIYRAFGATERWLMARYLVLALLLGGLAAALAALVGLAIDTPLAELASLLPGSTAQGVTTPFYLVLVALGGLALGGLAGILALPRSGQ